MAASSLFAPGAGSTNELGFATVSSVVTEANTELGLPGNNYTAAGSPSRLYQQLLKNALDNANNNLNFVQKAACTFSFPSAP